MPWQNTSARVADRARRPSVVRLSALLPTDFSRGRLITVEGIDGAGKSTHLPWLKEALERHGHPVWLTREP
ncbi:MAG TPA: hypothetical protein VJQ49_10290, partial [Casimicrobiaceae bacterium]|nr:hypothetical protein [Casimicrobiaceae bacterium]